jgi:hypothetical protein
MADDDTAFTEPFDSGVFNEAAAAKFPEWQRLLADAEASDATNLAALADMDDNQLTYLGDLSYNPYTPKSKEE